MLQRKIVVYSLLSLLWIIWGIGAAFPTIYRLVTGNYFAKDYPNYAPFVVIACLLWWFGVGFVFSLITKKFSDLFKALEAEDLRDEVNTPPPNFRELERDKMKAKLDVVLSTEHLEEGEEDENLVSIDEPSDEPTIEFVEKEEEFEHLKIFKCSMSAGYDLLEKEYIEWSKAQGDDIKITGRKVQTITNGFLLLVFYHKLEY